MTQEVTKKRAGKTIKWSVICIVSIIRLDVAKDESQVRSFQRRKVRYKQRFKFTHGLLIAKSAKLSWEKFIYS